jgi:uncharacterized protein (TIGR00369 family)
MSALTERVTRARETGDWSALAREIPYAAWLGITVSVQGDEVVVSLPHAPMHVGNATLPAIHGGVVGALLEHAASLTLLVRAETVVLPKTITFTVDYLRSARTVATHARAVITRQGRRVSTVRVEAYQDDPAKPVAAGHGHFLVMRDGEG